MDEQEFLEMIRQHQGILHKVCRLYRDSREDREDLFQEIVYQLWKSAPSFKGRSKITSWMYRIALNTALASFRKRTPDIIYPESLPEQKDGPGEIPPDLQHEQLFAALKQLKEGERALIALYLEDMSYQEIAAIAGIDENNIGVKLHRIKNKIKHLLKI